MNNEKLENLLNLALDATQSERERSAGLEPPAVLTPFWNFFHRLRSNHY